jgi:DnaA family protein
MNDQHPQQVFNLQLAPTNTFATFFDENTQVLCANLQALVKKESRETQIFLWGAKNTGKTHLLQAVCHLLANSRMSVMYIPLSKFDSPQVSMLDGLASLDVVCVDDIESVAGNTIWEQALFNFINQMRSQNTTIVFSSQQNPAHEIFNLADLNSRLVWGPVYHLPALDQHSLEAALKLHAKVRGIELPDLVIKYLFTHFKRDTSALVELLEVLDKASLQEQRKVTVPFIKQVLANR